jgi:hypothetical protein
MGAAVGEMVLSMTVDSNNGTVVVVDDVIFDGEGWSAFVNP